MANVRFPKASSRCLAALAAVLSFAVGHAAKTEAAEDGTDTAAVVRQVKLLSQHGSTRATRYASTNKIVSLDGKTHVAWLDSISNTMIASYDHASGTWTPPTRIGQGYDNHGGPALTCDSKGYLHVIFGPHGQEPFQHCRSAKPNDSTRWTEQPRFGSHPTYPSAVCDDQDTLHVVYRGGIEPRQPFKLLHQSRPRDGDWSPPRPLARAPDDWKGYTHYHATLTIAADNRLHVAYNIYYSGRAKEAGHMMSPDRGKTWTLADGRALELPVNPSSPAFFKRVEGALKVENVVCDSEGRPWVSVSTGDSKAGPTIYHHDGTAWKSLCPGERTEPKLALGELGASGMLGIDASDRLYVMTTLGKSVMGGVQGEVVLLYSDDRGRRFRLLHVFPPDEKLPHTGANMERPTGHHRIDVPWAIFSTGEKGPDCFGKGLFHKVRAVQFGIRD